MRQPQVARWDVMEFFRALEVFTLGRYRFTLKLKCVYWKFATFIFLWSMIFFV